MSSVPIEWDWEMGRKGGKPMVRFYFLFFQVIKLKSQVLNFRRKKKTKLPEPSLMHASSDRAEKTRD